MKAASTAIGNVESESGRAEMEEEDDDDDADDDGFFQKVALESFDGRVNQSRAVVAGDDFDTRRQRGFCLN